MEVVEVLYTKKECFTVFKDGHISMEKGEYTPSQVSVRDVCPRPEILGPRPANFLDDYEWEKKVKKWLLACEYADMMNYIAHQKQRKAFKKHLIEVRKRFNRQEALRVKEEKKKTGKSGFSIRSLISRIFKDRTRV